MESEWKRGHAFAEFAEAIGVETREVMAAWSHSGQKVTLLYTEPPSTLDSPVLMVVLQRDADGILVPGPSEDTGQTVGELGGIR